MRRESLVPIAVLLLASIASPLLPLGAAHAGMMANTNQSAAFVRMPARNAVLDVDGAIYNPAGLTELANGWYFSLGNQFAFRDRQAESDYPYLGGAPSTEFPAGDNTGFIPGLCAVYKANRSALSFAFTPIFGIGHAHYSRGLPAFEMIFSDLVPALKTSYGVTGYSSQMDFKETSTGYGYQLGASHKVHSAVSLFVGGRLVTAKRTYGGGIEDVSINPTIGYDGTFRRADVFAAENAASFTSKSQSYSSAATSIQALITGGAGSFTLSQAQTAGYITSTQRAQYEAALADLGLSSAQVAALNLNQVRTRFDAAKTHFAANAGLMTGIQALTQDRELDVTQTGAGFAPILGANLKLPRGWNVGLKYEFATKLELENDTRVDQFGTFPDGTKVRSDLPAMLSLGISHATSTLTLSSGLNYYFDRNADYGFEDASGDPIDNSDVIDSNYFELAVGAEYAASDKLLLSAGYLYGKTGANEDYQSLLVFSLDSHTLGFGGRYRMTRDLAVNAGCSVVMYSGSDRVYSRERSVPEVLPYGSTSGTPEAIEVTDTFSRSDLILAVGVDYELRK